MSSTYRPWPRRNRGSSFRLMEWPIPPTSGVVRVAMAVLLLLLRGRVLDRLDDVHVARAAAEVPRDRPPDVPLGRLGVGLDQRIAGHHHPGSTVAALQPVLLEEPVLDRMELAVLLEALDRHDLPAVGLDGEDRARLHRDAVEQDRARPAVRRVAADVRARQAEHVPQEMDQQEAGIHLGLLCRSVHRYVDLVPGHGYCPPALCTALCRARAVRTRAISRLYSTEPRRSA